MTKLILALALAALAGCATTKSPASRAQRAGLLFDELDTNHDGYLTRAELTAGLRYAGTPEINPNLVMGLNKDSSKKVKATRKLSEAEIRKAMAQAFETKPSSDLNTRVTKDEFKKVVSQRNADDDPWEPFMGD